MLVDRYGFAGGTSTAVLDTFYGFYTPGPEPRKVVGGIPDRVVDALDAHDAGGVVLRPNTYGAGTGVTYDPERLKVVWDGLLAAAGVRVLLHAFVVDAETDGGGRVTELVARPLLAALRPELTCVLQPLGGEYAGTRELLSAVPFAPGYGVEIGLLLDTYDRLGIDAIAQVNLGVRKHRNRPLGELGVMSRQIVGTMLARCGIPDSGAGLTQFLVDGDGFVPVTTEVSLVDRPPVVTVT